MRRDATAQPTPRQRILSLAVDAPNHDLLLKWMDSGELPNLARLRDRSHAFSLTSEKRFSNEHSWIPMLTGQQRDRWAHWLDVWNPLTYRFEEASL